MSAQIELARLANVFNPRVKIVPFKQSSALFGFLFRRESAYLHHRASLKISAKSIGHTLSDVILDEGIGGLYKNPVVKP